ncbi:MAG: zinc-ribbon domain-containing protein [Flavobacteriales bacterium]|nr:zinc-ribbon domain-containing protein [Flavobacteriales bacterium]
MVIIGYRSTLIGETTLSFTTCEECGTKNSYTVFTYGRYFHVFWIPLFPIGKTYLAECSHCKKAYSKERLFTKEVREAFHTERVRTPVKRPFWHSIGSLMILGIIGLSIITALIAIATDDGSAEKKRLAEEPFKEALEMDLAKLSSNVALDDSLTFYIKDCLSFSLNNEVNEDEIEYYTEMKEDKILILLRIRDIKKIKKKSRKKLIEFIEMCVNLNDEPNTRDLYIMVKGKYTPILLKTPFESDLGGYLASKSDLYPYYADDNQSKDSTTVAIEVVINSL